MAHEVVLLLLVAIAPMALFAMFRRPEGTSSLVVWMSLVAIVVVAAMPSAVVVLASARPNRPAIWITRTIIAVPSYALMSALYWGAFSMTSADYYNPVVSLGSYAFLWIGGLAMWGTAVGLAHHSAQQRLADRRGQLDMLAFARPGEDPSEAIAEPTVSQASRS